MITWVLLMTLNGSLHTIEGFTSHQNCFDTMKEIKQTSNSINMACVKVIK